jgi:hypothetical protein
VKDDETTASAVAFLKEAVRAFPFQVTHVLTDRGSCFVVDAASSRLFEMNSFGSAIILPVFVAAAPPAHPRW